MVRQDLVDWIKNGISQGHDVDSLRNHLIQGGYPQVDVDGAIIAIQNPPHVKMPQEQPLHPQPLPQQPVPAQKVSKSLPRWIWIAGAALVAVIVVVSMILLFSSESPAPAPAEDIGEPIIKESEEPEVLQTGCRDTDGGKDYDSIGVITYNGDKYKDYCYEDDVALQEYYCEGTELKEELYRCSDSCTGGECTYKCQYNDLCLPNQIYYFSQTCISKEPDNERCIKPQGDSGCHKQCFRDSDCNNATKEQCKTFEQYFCDDIINIESFCIKPLCNNLEEVKCKVSKGCDAVYNSTTKEFQQCLMKNERPRHNISIYN
ncbi:hypothetical protein ACFLZZ_00675 [Nanoarchaeota archaeon]